MDMFYAAVELRDRPELRGRPLVVGGSPRSRSVVTTATYEARRFGIRSGMSCAEARRRCPECLFIPPDFPKYERVAEQVRAIFREYTDRVEPVSLDEAYLDVTENKVGEKSATRIAAAIRARIRALTGLTASAGVGPSMLVAKLASEHRKPDGLFTVAPGQVRGFIRPLDVIRLPGVGRKTEERLRALGIRTAAQLADMPRESLVAYFGSFGATLHDAANGIDGREVTPVWERRSFGAEETFARDILLPAELLPRIRESANRAFAALQAEGRRARTVTLKIKYHDFRLVTRRRTADRFVDSPDQIMAIAGELLARTEAGSTPIRLAGIALSNFAEPLSGRPQTVTRPLFREGEPEGPNG